jgi:hypothetical protein
MIYRIFLCAFLWQLLASEHSRSRKAKSFASLHRTRPIVPSQQFRGVQW